MSGPDIVERCYLIRKQGSWYRPNAKGYTSSAIQAGRYTLAEAERHTHPNGKDGPRDGMDYLHEDDVADPDWQAYRAQVATITALQAEVERKDAALRDCRDYVDRKADDAFDSREDDLLAMIDAALERTKP